MISVLAALSGALGRYIYGGYLKPLPTQVGYLVFFVTGAMVLAPAGWVSINDLTPALFVALVFSLSWNPGHGSYADGGASPNKDDEDVRPITRIFAAALGAKDNQSLLYDSIGMTVRYGLSTGVTALAMAATNEWLGSDFGLWYAAVGLIGGPLMAGLALVTKDVQARWTAFEVGIGALLTGALALV